MEPEEYQEATEETMAQLCELNESLNKLISGDMTLVDKLGATQLVSVARNKI